MKRIILITLPVFLFSLGLNGQISKSQKPYTSHSTDSSNASICNTDTSYAEIVGKYGTPETKKIKPGSELTAKNFNPEIPITGQPGRKLFADRFPGSDRFYAKRPDLIKPGSKYLVKKPDQSSIYYLIIKDPLTNRRIN